MPRISPLEPADPAFFSVEDLLSFNGQLLITAADDAIAHHYPHRSYEYLLEMLLEMQLRSVSFDELLEIEDFQDTHTNFLVNLSVHCSDENNVFNETRCTFFQVVEATHNAVAAMALEQAGGREPHDLVDTDSGSNYSSASSWSSSSVTWDGMDIDEQISEHMADLVFGLDSDEDDDDDEDEDGDYGDSEESENDSNSEDDDDDDDDDYDDFDDDNELLDLLDDENPLTTNTIPNNDNNNFSPTHHHTPMSRLSALTLVAMLPVVDIATLDPADRQCAVCMEAYFSHEQQQDAPVRLPCPGRHVLGQDCLFRMLVAGESRCPFDRVDVVEIAEAEGWLRGCMCCMDD